MEKKFLDEKSHKKRNTGAEETIKFTEKLKYKGFKGQIYDFTAGMVKNNPAVNYKDANRYWTDYRRPISVLEVTKNA